MTPFKDETGGDWFIPQLNIQLVEDVREATGVDLYEAMEAPDKFSESLSIRKIGALFWALCESQTAEKKLDARGFARLMNGPTMERAVEALGIEIINFFQRSKIAKFQTESLRANLAKHDDAVIEALKKQSMKSPPLPE